MPFCSNDSKIVWLGQFLLHTRYQGNFTQEEIILFHAVYHQCHAIYQSQCLIFSSTNYVRTPKLKSPVFPGSKKLGEKMKRSIVSLRSSLRFLHYPELKQGPSDSWSNIRQFFALGSTCFTNLNHLKVKYLDSLFQLMKRNRHLHSVIHLCWFRRLGWGLHSTHLFLWDLWLNKRHQCTHVYEFTKKKEK